MDYEFLKQNLSEPVTDAIERDGITVGEAFTKMGVNHKVAATKLNSMVDGKFTDGIKNQKIDKNEFDDWFADIEKADPGKENWLKNTWVSYTNLFKGGVLSHPARLSRDYISAYARLAEQGMFSLRFAKDAQSIALGKGSKLAAEIPQIKEMLKARGITDASEEEAMENATRMIRLLFGGLGPGKHNIRSDIAELGVHDSQRRFGRDVQDILDAMPRKDPTTRREQAWDVLRMMTGRTKETSLNPLETR